MTTSFQKVGVFIKPSDQLKEPLERLAAIIRSCGSEVCLSEKAASALGEKGGESRAALGAKCDLAIVLGGDGSMLGVARDMAPFRVPVLGVNAGRLGFITDVVIDDMESVLPPMLAGSYQRDERFLVAADVTRNGETVFSGKAVNDIGISHGRAGGMVEYMISVDGQPMSTQAADGIICATATGSTAYSLAAGGPIMHPSLSGLCLVPVAPHTLSNRPIVLPASSHIDIKLTDAREAVAYFDMQDFCDLQIGDELRIHPTKETVTMLHPIDWNYYELLRRKLQWNFMPTGGNHSRGAR